GRTGHSRESDRERRAHWSHSHRDPRSGGRAHGGRRPRHRRFAEATLDIVRWSAGYTKRTAHSCATPARSHVRSAAQRSALPKTLRREAEVKIDNCLTENQLSGNMAK